MSEPNRRDNPPYIIIDHLNKEHGIDLVKEQSSGRVMVRKTMFVYQADVYRRLQERPVSGIPAIYSVAEDESAGKLVVTEEYISGTSLDRLMEEKDISFSEIIQIMTDLCDTLTALHTATPPIIHRDIKPSNIIIRPDGRAILIDFNAAKYCDPSRDRDTILIGTKGYAAPEQYGFGSSIPQTDIYAMGILLRELADSMPDHRGIFDDIIPLCTKLDPQNRFSSAAALRSALLSLKSPVAHTPAPDAKKHKHPNPLPPGFRSGTAWKRNTACVLYVLMLLFPMLLRLEGMPASRLWLNRGFLLLIELEIFAIGADYLGIRRIMPLCRSRHRILRILGAVILATFLAFALLLLLVVIEDAVYGA